MAKLIQREVSATRNHAGAWVVSALHGGYLVTRVYYGYTKREAIRKFTEERNEKVS